MSSFFQVLSLSARRLSPTERLGVVAKATIDKYKQEIKNAPPIDFTQLTPEQKRIVEFSERKVRVTRIVGWLIILAFGWHIGSMGWKESSEETEYVFDRYGRRLDPKSGALVPRAF